MNDYDSVTAIFSKKINVLTDTKAGLEYQAAGNYRSARKYFELNLDSEDSSVTTTERDLIRNSYLQVNNYVKI